MILTTIPARARRAGRIRLVILTAVSLLVAHTAIYATEDGLGAAYATAMSASGHDGWWLPASLVVLAGAAVLAGTTAGRLARLELRARRLATRRRGDPSFGPEAVAIGRRLVPLVLVLFAIQENLEGLIAHGRLLGIEAIVGPAHPLAIPVLILVTLALSVAGALVRWRIAALRRRIATGRGRAPRRVGADHAGPGWGVIGALAPRRWMLDRLDAGRSPPAVLPA
jgi:hypothetical protein